MIDELDRELFRLGTINVKAPDVWGQNRMTKYRAEFETEMAKDVSQFHFTLSAALRRADLAVLTSSTSLGAALNPAGAQAATAPAITQATAPATPPWVQALSAILQSGGQAQTAAAPGQTAAAGQTASSGQAAAAAPAVTPPSPDTTSQLQYLAQRLDKLASSNLLQFPQSLQVGLEPTVQEDEKANYINHLHELRRINAGDDLTDGPGYGLYLIRIPITLLPGPEVRRG